MYDHRQTDRLLDQRDEINNKLVQMRGKCATFGEDPQKMADFGREMSFLRQRSVDGSAKAKRRAKLQDIESQSNRSLGKSPTFFTIPKAKKKETSSDRSLKLADLEHELEVVDSMILEEREKAWNGVPDHRRSQCLKRKRPQPWRRSVCYTAAERTNSSSIPRLAHRI